MARPPKPPKDKELAVLLRSWIHLNNGLTKLPEVGVLRLLAMEIEGKNRRSFVLRIQQRKNRLRSSRERAELSAATPLYRQG